MLTLGSTVLAVINIGVMWAMAHRWRYAWHSNFALQLLWVPYDILTKQYGMLALSAIVAGVSLKACVLQSSVKEVPAAAREMPAATSQHQPRRRGIRAFSPGRLLAALTTAETDARHTAGTGARPVAKADARRAGRTGTRRADKAGARPAGRTDTRRAGLLSSARGRHAARRWPVISALHQSAPLPAGAEGTLVRRKEPVPG